MGGLVREARIQKPDALGKHRVRQEFEEREQHEGSFVHAGMGNSEGFVGDRQVVDEEDVDVDRAGAPMDVAGSAEAGLDTTARSEEIVRLEIVVDLEDDVQEIVLHRTTDGIGFPYPRTALNANPRFGAEQVDSALQRLEAAADVRAEPEEGLHPTLPPRGGDGCCDTVDAEAACGVRLVDQSCGIGDPVDRKHLVGDRGSHRFDEIE
jgi:hypothetical protein